MARLFEDRPGRARNPLSLSTRAARYGAVACVVAGTILAVPVVQGYRDGAAPVLPPESGWDALRQFGREMAAQDVAR